MISPTQRSLNKLKKEGWEIYVVEKWIPQARKRIDAFGFGDILGYKYYYHLKPLFGSMINYYSTVLFQVTSGSNFAARKKKILENKKAKNWLKCGNGICIHGWRKLKNKKTKKYEWKCKEEWIQLGDFNDDK